MDTEPKPFRFTVKSDIFIDDDYLNEARKAGHNPPSDKIGYLYPCDVHFEIKDDEINIVGVDRQVLITNEVIKDKGDDNDRGNG